MTQFFPRVLCASSHAAMSHGSAGRQQRLVWGGVGGGGGGGSTVGALRH